MKLPRVRPVLLGPVAVVLAALVVAGCCGRRVDVCSLPCGCPPPLPGYAPDTVKPLPPPVTPPKPSGFLQDYARLRPNPKHAGAHGWLKEGVDLRTYDELLIEPVQLLVPEGPGAVVLTEEQKAKVVDGFRKILFDRLDPYYPVVEESGPTVLRVRLALTDLQPVEKAEDGAPVRPGGAELEVQILDSVSGDLLVEAVSRIEGSTRGEVAKPEWQPVEGAFREWADRLLDFLESFQPVESR